MNFEYRLDKAMNRPQSHLNSNHRRNDSIDFLGGRNGSDVTKFSLNTNTLSSPTNSLFSQYTCSTDPNNAIDLNIITRELNLCRRRFSVPLDKTLKRNEKFTKPIINDRESSSLDGSSYKYNDGPILSNNDILNDCDLKEILQSKKNKDTFYNQPTIVDMTRYENLELPSTSVDLLNKYGNNFARGHRRSISNSLKNKFRSLRRYKSH